MHYWLRDFGRLLELDFLPRHWSREVDVRFFVERPTVSSVRRLERLTFSIPIVKRTELRYPLANRAGIGEMIRLG